ncbi:MAG TPA: FixH family protein, partial [Phenylobacterium sp.]|nr:FixH family protein [Phenylobacterium sp.]
MSDVTRTPAAFRVTGWHVLITVTGFFLLVFAVDFYFVSLAYKTFPGQVSVTPYEDGVAYNRKLAQIAAQHE